MTTLKRTAAVTGAFSYTGSYIARALLDRGWQVVTLTRHPDRPHPLRERIQAFPLDFSQPDEMQANLRGVHTLVNTYWVRFNYSGSSFDQAVENSRALISAAENAGVRRIIHISVSNPRKAMPSAVARNALQSSADEATSTTDGKLKVNNLPYYAGKAQVEQIITSSDLSYAILQPTLIFGKEEVLVHNIAWLLRHLPIFAIAGDGRYRLQPIFVEDLAEMAAKAAGTTRNEILPAAGPEVYTYAGLIQLLKQLIGSRALILHMPPWLTLLMAKVVGLLLQDITLTREELQGLMEERLYVGEPALGSTRFSDWAKEHRTELGMEYKNELKRHHQKR